MALADSLQSLRDLDFNDLTLDTVGSWPIIIKIIVWLILFGVVGFLGYNYHLKAMLLEFDTVVTQEAQLREEYRVKAFDAAQSGGFARAAGRDGRPVWCVAQPIAFRHGGTGFT